MSLYRAIKRSVLVAILAPATKTMALPSVYANGRCKTVQTTVVTMRRTRFLIYSTGRRDSVLCGRPGEKHATTPDGQKNDVKTQRKEREHRQGNKEDRDGQGLILPDSEPTVGFFSLDRYQEMLRNYTSVRFRAKEDHLPGAPTCSHQSRPARALASS